MIFLLSMHLAITETFLASKSPCFLYAARAISTALTACSMICSSSLNRIPSQNRTSFSPLMAEHLSYLKSKSHSYVYEFENKRIARADENFAREVMQLFSSECADSTEIFFSTL